jgi:transketolase N-terminal domain/subunit
MGLAAAVGYALAGKPTHCIISDGECAEGIVWESLAYAAERPRLPLTVHVNANGFTALRPVNIEQLEWRLKAFYPTVRVWRTDNAPLANDLAAHYKTIGSEEGERYAATVR